MGRQFQFGKSNSGRTACIGHRPAPQDRERLLWRTSTFEQRLAYGGCTLRPVIGAANFANLVRPDLADSRRS